MFPLSVLLLVIASLAAIQPVSPRPAKATNAERFRRGLPPLPPRNLLERPDRIQHAPVPRATDITATADFSQTCRDETVENGFTWVSTCDRTDGTSVVASIDINECIHFDPEANPQYYCGPAGSVTALPLSSQCTSCTAGADGGNGDLHYLYCQCLAHGYSLTLDLEPCLTNVNGTLVCAATHTIAWP